MNKKHTGVKPTPKTDHKTVKEKVCPCREAGANPRFFLPYGEALVRQKHLAGLRIRDRIHDKLLLVEHEPVVTMGARSKGEHLLLTQEEFHRRGTKVTATDRGGDVTYHGPGQLVAYPVLKLQPEERDTHRYVSRLEETAIRTLAGFGIEAFRIKGSTGVWTGKGKIAAIGVRLKHWVTYHGISLNIRPDLKGFQTIIPCGLKDRRVSSMEELLAPLAPPSQEEAADSFIRNFREVFKRDLTVLYGGLFAEKLFQKESQDA